MKDEYKKGMADFYFIMRGIFEMTPEERIKVFKSSNVATILDNYDYKQIRKMMYCKKMYVIRGINVDKNGFKKVVAESGYFNFKPKEVVISTFMKMHKDATFACVEEIYVRNMS